MVGTVPHPNPTRRPRIRAAFVCIALVLTACTAAPSSAASSAANATVAEVVDGDTIDVDIGGRRERVRLLAIDTPEIAHDAFADRPATDADCFGPDAQAYTESMLPAGTALRLERDVVGRDHYGRLLAYVYRADDGVFVNYELVRQGYATPLSFEPNLTHADLMVDAATRAEADDIGLWAAC